MSEMNLFEDRTEGSWEDSLLSGLNPEQRRAVSHDEGPLLILAGAGSGKTRVITFRISYLVRIRHIRPSAILAITFTNKAAAEMKDRIRELVGDMATYMWVGTFHAMFARILRRHADLLQFEKNFSILDMDDQQKIIKECISELNLNDKIFVPRSVQSEISKAKNELLSPSDFEKDAGPDYRRQKVAIIYRKYQEKMRASNAMDFDDILFFANELLSKNPDILSYYQEQFKYILVDEYQDTNHAQYKLILMLARKYRNLCVVGDDDQSIYSFRGANIRNILDFEKDFKETTVIKLEQNYRSTANILEAANTVIRHNRGRKVKKLWTQFDPGDKITYYCADHHGAEAYYVTDQINRLVRSGSCKYGDIAILYRLNALSRTIEAALREQGIPYRVYGGQRFYDRKEIKDILAYLRLIMSPSDNYAFDRIINVPKRGIGDTTVDRVKELAVEEGVSYMQICALAPQYPELSRASLKLQQFSYMLDSFRQKLMENQMSFAEFIDYVQEQSGVMQEIIEQKEKKGETVDRIENMRELLSEAVEFEARRKNQVKEKDNLDSELGADALSDQFSHEDTTYDTDLKGILQSYLENAALYSEGDNEGTSDDFVRLLTIHSAKGLEFSVVFLVGAEEGIFPGTRSMESEEAIEEERRLAYVAITRARKKLHITSARSRMLFGQTQELPPSRFIREIDPQYMESIGVGRRSFVDEGPAQRSSQTSSTYGSSAGQSGSSSRPFGSTVFGSPQRTSVAGIPSDPNCLTPEAVSKGMEVRHPRFGKGVVMSVEKVAGDALVCVVFENKTTRNMLVRQAKLVIA